MPASMVTFGFQVSCGLARIDLFSAGDTITSRFVSRQFLAAFPNSGTVFRNTATDVDDKTARKQPSKNMFRPRGVRDKREITYRFI